jgi:hypothetical protein
VANTNNLLSLAPSVNAQQQIPASILQQIGGQQEGREQQLINAEQNRFNFEQQAPQNALNSLAPILSQAQGGQSQSITTPGAQTNPIAGAFGGAAIGQSLFGGAQPQQQTIFNRDPQTTAGSLSQLGLPNITSFGG